jgi:hypothetical protein
MKRITDETAWCRCGWKGIVIDCEPDIDGDGGLGCPNCGRVANTFVREPIAGARFGDNAEIDP